MDMVNIGQLFEQIREKHDIDTVNSTSEGLKYIIDRRFISEFAGLIISQTLALAAQEAKCIVDMEPDYLGVGSETYTSIVDRNSITNLIFKIIY